MVAKGVGVDVVEVEYQHIVAAGRVDMDLRGSPGFCICAHGTGARARCGGENPIVLARSRAASCAVHFDTVVILVAHGILPDFCQREGGTAPNPNRI